MSGRLVLVGTPIGNLEDITDRARKVLAAVDVIAAEDTRRTGRLLQALGIEGRLMSLFEGNEARRVRDVLQHLRAGRDVALVSDAGMPGISDPGYLLVSACVREGIEVDVVPGPSAVLAALVVSGLPTARFAFEGFLPRSGRARRERLDAIAREERTVVLFESPHRAAATLEDLLGTGDRRVALCRELTKLHQEVVRGRLSEVLERVREHGPRGEVVLVVEGVRPDPGGDVERGVRIARELVEAGSAKREAARRAREATGASSREIYDRLLDD